MAETSGPWDGSGFAQDEWRDLFGFSALDGVLLRDGEVTGLAPSFSASTREITFSAGYAKVRGNLYESDDDIILDVPVPSGSNQRIDYVVLRYDPSQILLNDRIQMVLVMGAEAANPSPPALTQDHDGVWEWPRIQIGPYGSGAITGAPWRYMGATVKPPVAYIGGSDPNDRVPGLSTDEDALVVNSGGLLWRYDRTSGQYTRLGAPVVGTISAASGWAHYDSSAWQPNYRLSADGLVTLRGIFRRTGSTIEITNGVILSNALPSAIRPGNTQMIGAVIARLRMGSSTGPEDYSTVRISLESSTFRLAIWPASGTQRVWASSSGTDSWVSIGGLSWWV